MTRAKSWRCGCAIGLAAVLIGFAPGCQPAPGTGSAPTTSKPDKQPDDNKGKPGKPPKPDVG